MAINTWGANGIYVNKLGSAIGHYVDGQNVLTALPHPSNKPPTLKQLHQQGRFGLMTRVLSYIGDLIRIGFATAKKRNQSAMNAAVAYNLANAVTGVYPDFEIDYPELLFSKGRLDVGVDAAVVAVTGRKLTLT